MTDQGFLRLRSTVLELLRTSLDPRLTYHCTGHTKDVLLQLERIAFLEKITDTRLLLLMRLAALFHDTGFLHTYKGHEEASCVIMMQHLTGEGFQTEELETIRRMIMATRLPQSPATLPEMIMCDADLDYLGRSDFEKISHKLKNEFLAYGVIRDEDEWNRLQVSFFTSHRYFTGTSIRERLPVKMQHLEKIKAKLVTGNL